MLTTQVKMVCNDFRYDRWKVGEVGILIDWKEQNMSSALLVVIDKRIITCTEADVEVIDVIKSKS